MNNKNTKFDLSQLTPELMEQFMEFYENLQATKVEEVKQETKSKVKGKRYSQTYDWLQYQQI